MSYHQLRTQGRTIASPSPQPFARSPTLSCVSTLPLTAAQFLPDHSAAFEILSRTLVHNRLDELAHVLSPEQKRACNVK